MTETKVTAGLVSSETDLSPWLVHGCLLPVPLCESVSTFPLLKRTPVILDHGPFLEGLQPMNLGWGTIAP